MASQLEFRFANVSVVAIRSEGMVFIFTGWLSHVKDIKRHNNRFALLVLAKLTAEAFNPFVSWLHHDAFLSTSVATSAFSSPQDRRFLWH
eukprot:3008775-Amphidinium_carterae.1